jgi:hypothetical protein
VAEVSEKASEAIVALEAVAVFREAETITDISHLFTR